MRLFSASFRSRHCIGGILARSNISIESDLRTRKWSRTKNYGSTKVDAPMATGKELGLTTNPGDMGQESTMLLPGATVRIAAGRVSGAPTEPTRWTHVNYWGSRTLVFLSKSLFLVRRFFLGWIDFDKAMSDCSSGATTSPRRRRGRPIGPRALVLSSCHPS